MIQAGYKMVYILLLYYVFSFLTKKWFEFKKKFIGQGL